MAGNNSIQILRGNNVKTNATIRSQTLLDGQPLYDRSTGYLFVGDGNTIANTTAVNAHYANSAGTASSATIANTRNRLYFDGNGTSVSWNGSSSETIYVPTSVGSSGQVWGVRSNGTVGWVAQTEVPGTIDHANTADVAYGVSGSNVVGTVSNANYSNYANTAYGVSGSNVSGSVANSNYANYAGVAFNVSAGNAIALGLDAKANNTNATALGHGATASGDYATAIGHGTIAAYTGATALGHGAHALLTGATALGSDAVVIGQYATALGYGAKASGSYATALGYGAVASGQYATALGNGAEASGDCAIAIGDNATVTSHYTIVLGDSSITSLRCQVQTISQLSDSRVKEDVSLANTAQCLVDVNRLPVSRFKYKEFTGTHIDVHRTGFMADDVEKVFPKSVAIADETFPVLDEEGNKVYEQEVDEKGNPVYEQAVDENGVALFNEDGSIKYDETKPVMKEKTFVMEDVKSIAMEMAIPTLWGAVQELTKRVESLEAELSLRQ